MYILYTYNLSCKNVHFVYLYEMYIQYVVVKNAIFYDRN